MTPPNPFIDLAQDPIGAIAAAGYLVLVFGILFFGTPHALRTFIEVYVDWTQNKERKKWARLWGDGVGYIPPFVESLKVLWACIVLYACFQAAAALLWFAGV